MATLDLATRTLIGRTSVCAQPRGIAYNSSDDTVLVACATGVLVSLPAQGGPPTRISYIDQDLRDVLVINGGVYVTRFREAEVLSLGTDWSVTGRYADGTSVLPQERAGVAWRSVATPDGRIVMVHQFATNEAINVDADAGSGMGAYTTGAGGPMGGGPIVMPGVTVFGAGNASDGGVTVASGVAGVNQTADLVFLGSTLDVDVAVSPDGSRAAIASAGILPLAGTMTPGQVFEFPLSVVQGFMANAGSPLNHGQVIAVAYAPSGELLAQSREPAALISVSTGSTVSLATDSRQDTGHTIFHTDPGGGLACASCHPEGTDDGHIWNFVPTGARRTQSLRGHLLSRAPFHWEGDLRDMGALVTEVFTQRMSGGALAPDQVNALGHWLDAQPALPAPSIPTVTPSLVARGQQLFQDPTVGCATCHSGSLFTNNTVIDVGTGGAHKVPSLVAVSWRAPFLHNGCALTLGDRFTDASCGGGDHHGHTSQLASGDIDALVAYLESL